MNDTPSSMRIAILTHSTNARGGVVHALELADALMRLGHTAVVHAPDEAGKGFFRDAKAPTVCVPTSSVNGDIVAMVETRVADYIAYFKEQKNRHFDIFHAQDSISGNALATLKQRGLIPGFARTVHHIDHFNDPRLQTLQHRSIATADQHFVVSRMWSEYIAIELSKTPVIVGNGVDTRRYCTQPSPRDIALREQLALRGGPVLLSIGGVEERKNSIRILEAFRQLHAIHPTAQLVIAGGASVLDHRSYRRQFQAALDAAGLPASSVVLTGVMSDADMPSLYRLADALVFASVREGFGLAVLEAMASGLPAVVSHIAPFTEYLTDDDVVWCDPLHTGSIANAMASVLAPPVRAKLRTQGIFVAQRHDWLRTARAHLPAYLAMREIQYA